MTDRFISEPVTVRTGQEQNDPIEFEWQGTVHRVVEVAHRWSDWGFAAGAHQRNWRTRRHRNYYRVRTDADELFELYLDRGTPSPRPVWVLLRQLDPSNAEDRDGG